MLCFFTKQTLNHGPVSASLPHLAVVLVWKGYKTRSVRVNITEAPQAASAAAAGGGM
jgi:hypothetical protein